MDPRAAWVLGAVLAPTDAAAVAGLAKRLPRRTLTTLRAESLINDGTALVLFGVATSRWRSARRRRDRSTIAGSFVGSYAGGIAAGLLASGLVVLVRRRLDDPQREGTLSVLTPFLAFLFAELVHASGVVAVVVAGLVLTHAVAARHPRPVPGAGLRVLGPGHLHDQRGLFVLVGLQFRRVVEGLDGKTLVGALGVAVAITAVVIGTRLVWVQTTPYIIRAIDRRAVQRTRRVGWRQRMVSGWSGFRGAVSLATALAVPATVAGGAPFPDRDLIVFVAAVVILLTILVQGTTLPAGGALGPAARGHRARRGAGNGPRCAPPRPASPPCRGWRPISASTANTSTGCGPSTRSTATLAADDDRREHGDPGPRPAAAARRALGEAAGGHRAARRQRDRRHRAARAPGGDGRRGGPAARARLERLTPVVLLKTLGH